MFLKLTMGKIFGVLQVLIFGGVWISVTCQLSECMTPRCSCCKDQVCNDNDDFCTNGCIERIWGNKCYNSCPSNCITCDQRSSKSGYPCSSCIDGKYGPECTSDCVDGRYGTSCSETCRNNCVSCTDWDNCNACVDGHYGTSCRNTCRNTCVSCTEYNKCNNKCVKGFYGSYCHGTCQSNCVSCSSFYNCDECVVGRYGTYCTNRCSSGCEGGKCGKTDGSCICINGHYGTRCENECAVGCLSSSCDPTDGTCTCKAGITGPECDQCTNAQGSYPNCVVCPDKCSTCSSSSICDTCKDGYFNDYNAATVVTVSDCSHSCRSTCNTCSEYDSCTSCKNGRWGQTCLSSCSHGCNGGICDKNNGHCSCTSGFKGNKCDHCESGRHGNNCDQVCQSTNCFECDRYNGICSSCKVGYYGNSQCNSVCSSGCKNKYCDFNDGVCTNGCLPNYSGDKCCVNNNNCKTCSSSDQCSACEPGYSGDKCCLSNDRCQTCSSPSACAQCKTGYSGDKCCLENTFCKTCSSNTVCLTCIDGKHGDSCTETCPANCAETFCRNDGSCNSCKSGFYGGKCEKECLQNCDECNDNGECIKCIEGFFGINCDHCPANCTYCSSLSVCSVCYPGFYGSICETVCSKCKEGTKCDKYNGYCEEACKDGMTGQSCNSQCNNGCVACDRTYASRCTVCADGRFGKNSGNAYYHCSNVCASNCYNQLCNASTGYCDTCIEGYKGVLCDCPVNCQCTEAGKCDTCLERFANSNRNCTECALNLYGVDCQTECNNNCLDNDHNTKCHGTNGTCFVGCSDGFFGNSCDLSCDQNCVNGTCSRIDGICSYGCKDGFTDSGAICVIAEASVGDDAEGSGAVIGGSVGGVIVVLAVVGVLMFVFLKRRRGNNNKFASPYANDDTQNNLKNMSGSAHIYDNTTETVNIYPPETEENVNNVIKPVSNPNYNKPPVKPKPKVEDIRKSVKIDDSRNSVKPENLRKSVKPEEPPEIDFDNVANDVLPTTTATEGNYGYYNVAGMKRGLPVAKLAEHVAKRDKDDFEQEFKEFGNGLVRPYLDSQKPQNRARNRYQQIYPYDEHRVHLEGSSTDYINASHIDGYQHPKEYIACLGPTEKASEKFVIVWMMIWEQKVEKIAMVTNLFENGAMKCEQYWPDVTTSLKYGDVTVTCHSEDEYADYTLRSFTVSKDSENRSLHHIHYTAWPDKGVPDNVTSIIEFRQRVNSITTKLGGPVIVHCSAGVGRTGTYIALDSLTKEGKDTKSVNIHSFVQKMREQRVNMVQTAEQYQYLHSAVVHSLTFDCAAITAEQFKRHFNNLDDKTMAAKFKQLQSTVEKKSEDEVKAIAVNKKHKDLNRAGADIPGDYRRPKLHINKDTDSCDYINAVLVNSFKTKNRFIVAMTPLPGTVLDFLTLLYQENCSCIVSLEAPESLNDKNVGTYYPADNQELKHGVFKVTCTKGVTSDSYVMRKLTITYNKQAVSTSKTFNHFQFTKWTRGGHVPSDPATFLQMILDVETKANATADNGPILIHCLNGSARSGLYCALSILREKMEIEHEVSVVNTVRYIKARRPSAIPNKDQYAFCHQAVVAYLDTFDKDIYSNFSLKL